MFHNHFFRAVAFSAMLFVFTQSIIAQSSEMFSYQAVVRNSTGSVIPNQLVSFRINVLKNSAAGVSVYEETHTLYTNEQGLANFYIGSGAISFGIFYAINWADDVYYLKVELDEQGGSNYTDMGTSQFVSVPYAMYAQKAGNAKTYSAGSGISITNDTINSEWNKNGNTLYNNNADVAIGSNYAYQKLDVNGAIKVGNTGTNADGSIRYNNNDMEGYVGGKWTSFTQSTYQSFIGGSMNSNVRNAFVYSNDSMVVQESGYYLVTFNVNGYSNATYTTPIVDYDYSGVAALHVSRPGFNTIFTPQIPFFQKYDDIGYGASYIRYMPYNGSNFVVYPFNAGDVVKLAAAVNATSASLTDNWGIGNYFVTILKVKNN